MVQEIPPCRPLGPLERAQPVIFPGWAGLEAAGWGVVARPEVWLLSALLLLNRYADERLWTPVIQRVLVTRLKSGEALLHAPWKNLRVEVHPAVATLPATVATPHPRSNFSHDSHVAACALLLLLNIKAASYFLNRYLNDLI